MGGSGRRLATTINRITGITLQNNNLQGLLPVAALWEKMDLLNTLDLSSNDVLSGGAPNVLDAIDTDAVTHLPCIDLGSMCETKVYCSIDGSSTGSICSYVLPTSQPTALPTFMPTQEPATSAPTPAASGGFSITTVAFALVFGVLVGLLVFLLYRRYRHMRKKQRRAKEDAKRDVESPPARSQPEVTVFQPSIEPPALPPPRRAVRHSVVERAMNIVGADPKSQIKKRVKNTLDRKQKMDKILASPVLYDKFLDLAERYFAQESVLFWKAVDRFERYRDMQRSDPANFQKLAMSIINEYVKPGSPLEINISDEQRGDLLAIRPGKFTAESFATAKAEVTHMLAVNFLAHFLKEHDAASIDAILDEVNEEDEAEQFKGKLLDEDLNTNTLMNLGFSKQEAQKALKRFNNDVEQAATFLITGDYE